ncbi:TetR family transcriptional regulator [Nitratireductor pacificus pht-3B]|uniref:TetR family transcriptional regulator n=1 Tax=Nitratireductor pacificus pht-3B TaxID=391937 RepID=K2LNZ5_9HYPH|nr:TetR family transcriptional regulator [Nitratireductor pacificus pht-3B]
MPKDKRRQQLLAAAMKIVREEGADELTLGTLAVKAGVSRPVAYDHFSTRAGLLMALYQQLEDRFITTLRDALGNASHGLAAVADMMSDGYFNCHVHLGPEAQAVSAALKGSEEMAAQQQTMIDRYVGIMHRALRPFSILSDKELRLLCVGLLGAAEAMAREMHAGRVAEAVASEAFSSLIVRSIKGQDDSARI